MHYKIIANGGGGIFSILMDIALPNIPEDATSVSIKIGKNQLSPDADMFDYVLHQQPEGAEVHCGFRGNEITISKGILSFKDNPIVPKNTLGVHIRIFDMNKRHGNFGILTFDDYKKAIAQAVDDMNPSHIFVASDNWESINKLRDIYGDKLLYNHFIRGDNETSDTYAIQLANSSNPVYWQEAFIDMLSLSKCKGLVYRRSNFAGAAVYFSDTIIKQYKL